MHVHDNPAIVRRSRRVIPARSVRDERFPSSSKSRPITHVPPDHGRALPPAPAAAAEHRSGELRDLSQARRRQVRQGGQVAGRSGRVRQGYKPRARWLRAHRRMGVGPAPEAAVQPGHRALQVRRAVRYGLHRRHARRGRAQSAPPQRRAARRRGIHPRGAAQAPDQGEILGGSRADATGPPAARRRVRRPPQGAGDLSRARR